MCKGFQLIESNKSKAMALVLSSVIGFDDSEQFQRLDKDEMGSPHFVFSALSEYWRAVTGNSLEIEKSIIEIIEVLCNSEDRDIHSLIIENIFEALEDLIDSGLYENLGERAKKMYQFWMS